MDNEQPHQELVKCVVVGDTAVGKTRLICARACNKQVSLGQLLSTHVPTVWAIDQYRIYKDVLERSWEIVDSVSVSLRLWDTFGDHEKDRRFAYGRSDVVLLCFSVNNPISLRNCRLMWYPEIRSFCPNTPVLLVGCKNDLRYMYRDEAYLSYFRERSPFVRATRKADLVMPDEARDVARELGLHYYETSVLTYYGVNEVFENAIRAALMARRAQRFWMTNLKRVQRPLLQAPFKPPPPPKPEVVVSNSTFAEDTRQLWLERAHADVIIVSGSVGFPVHRFILAAASPALYRLLTADLLGRSTSDSSMVSSLGEFADDTECLMRAEQKVCRQGRKDTLLLTERVHRDRGGVGGDALLVGGKVVKMVTAVGMMIGAENDTVDNLSNNMDSLNNPIACLVDIDPPTPTTIDVSTLLDHPLTASADNNTTVLSRPPLLPPSVQHGGVQQVNDLGVCVGVSGVNSAAFHSVKQVDGQTVITMTRALSPNAVQLCLQFAYTGMLDRTLGVDLQDLRRAAELLELPHLVPLLSSHHSHHILNATYVPPPPPPESHADHLRRRLQDVCLDQGLFADVIFELDDGGCAAHKPMLAARCDMMRAMFSGDFRESQAKVIEFPGVREYTFHKLLHFLYTDDVPAVQASRCVNLLELANRLCLPRLVALVERRVIEDLERLPATEAIDQCLRLLEPVKLHNAHQLAEFCMNHLCVNYNKLCRMSPRSLRLLHPDNQAYLVEHRWPPVWYLKDYDYYQKCLVERDREVKPNMKSSSGCLCFTRKSESDPALSTSTDKL